MRKLQLVLAVARRIARPGVAAAALSAILLVGPGAATAAPLLQSDPTWKVTPDNSLASTGWNNSLGFDDSAWQSATVLYDVGAVTSDPTFDGTKGIWSSGGQFSTTETQIWIRRVFTLADPPSVASLIVGCDDDCTVYVNGSEVINDTNGSANNNTVADMLPFLNVGTNLIAYTATDNYPVWGYNHSTWLQLDGRLQSTSVPEPATIALLGIGLAGLGFSGRRRLR